MNRLSHFILGAFLLCSAAYAQDISTLTNGTTKSICSYSDVTIAPGHETVIAEVNGAGCLRYFYLTDGPENMTNQDIVLRIYWDGKDYPSVNVPVVDFFGSIAGRPIEWESEYLCVHHCIHQCYFPMPFSKGAKVCLYNDSEKDYKCLYAYNFDFVMDKAYKHDKSRFHAAYNRSNPTGGFHTLIDVKGHGQYVGNILHVFANTDKYWAEGDTDMILDGQEMKHTPGTEDEYGSCYDLGFKFRQRTCGYIEGGLADPNARWGSHRGHNRLYRFYTDNPIRFRKGLKVVMQNHYYDPNNPQPYGDEDYTSVVYYYLEGASAVKLMPYGQRTAESKAKAY